MRSKTNLLLFVVGMLTFISTASEAGEIYSIEKSAKYHGTPTESATAFLADSTELYNLENVDLEPVRVLALRKLSTVRFVQIYEGLPVIGRAAAVRVRPDGDISVASFNVARELKVSTVPAISVQQARLVVVENHGPAAAHVNMRYALAVLPGAKGTGSLVWQVDVLTGDGGHRYLIDAHHGVVLQYRPLAIHALGRVYPISSVNTPTPEDLVLLGLDTLNPQVLTGWEGDLAITNYVSGDSSSGMVVEQVVEPNSGEDFLYDPPADETSFTDEFAQVGLYYHLSRIKGFFQDTLAVDMSGADWKLTAVANVGEGGDPMDNAYFSQTGIEGDFASPNLIAVGQGTILDFADDSDVFLHEYTHYVSHNAVGYNMGQMAANEYGSSPFSGSIDEGLADYFACTENGDAQLGEASLALMGSGRDLTDTSKVCPDDILGEVHYDGEIIGSAAWTVRELLGKEAADQVIWGALSLLQPYASFGEFAEGVIVTAEDLASDGTITDDDVQSIEDAYNSRGLMDCFQEIPIDEDTPRPVYMFGLNMFASYMGGTCQDVRSYGISSQSYFHFKATPSEGDLGIRFSVEQSTTESDDDFSWNVYARIGEHVGFSSAGFTSEATEYDYVSDTITVADGDFVIDENSDPPFDPSSTYHFVLVHQNCPTVTATLSVEPIDNSPDDDAGSDDDSGPIEDSGVDDGKKSESGCGCNSVGSSNPGVLSVLF